MFLTMNVELKALLNQRRINFTQACLLISNGADPDTANDKGKTLLFMVLDQFRLPIDDAMWLIERGADPDTANSAGSTLAVLVSHSPYLKRKAREFFIDQLDQPRFDLWLLIYMVEHLHVDINVQNSNGKALLHLLAIYRPDLISRILPFKPDFTIANMKGEKSLDLIRNYSPQLLSDLIDTYTDKASSQAILESFIEMQVLDFNLMIKLLEHGADPQTKDVNQDTLMDLSKKEKDLALMMRIGRFYPAVQTSGVKWSEQWLFYHEASKKKKKALEKDAKEYTVPFTAISNNML